MQEPANSLLHAAGIADRVRAIGTFRRHPRSGRTVDWIYSDLVSDAERGQANSDEVPDPSGSSPTAPANKARPPRVFLGSGDRGIYGFGAAPSERVPGSLLFVLDPATLSLEVQRGLLNIVVTLWASPENDGVVLRSSRFGRTGAPAVMASIHRLISMRAPRGT